MSQLAEKSWPYVFTAILVAGWWWGLKAPFPAASDGLLAASGGASAVLVGFLATSKAIILSVSASAVFAKIKNGKYHTLIFDYLYQAIIFGMAFLVVSLLGFFVDRDPAAPSWFAALWVTLGICSFLLFLRITRILFKMLKWI